MNEKEIELVSKLIREAFDKEETFKKSIDLIQLAITLQLDIAEEMQIDFELTDFKILY